MGGTVLDLKDVGLAQVAAVGGKGAHLGELVRMDGLRVPPGFCVTTDAFRRILSASPLADDLIDRLTRVGLDEHDAIRSLSAELRGAIEAIPTPADVAAEVTVALARLGDEVPCAVRSSATAEDLPTASFAGQQDSYLNVVGAAAILRHVGRCWASLFTERAVTYRLRNGFDHRSVRMAVVVQRMVFPEVAGILFTADPVTGNRRIASVEAIPGLGEALAAGVVNADRWTVRDGAIVDRVIAARGLGMRASPEEGTRAEPLAATRREDPSLSDEQVLRLTNLGRRIEAHFSRPQDIEWCLVDDAFHVVQGRPITTLFPIPAREDDENHVYISVGHQQMMTDPIKPLGISMWQLTAAGPMHEAGARLFVDATRALASPATRPGLLALIGRSDPLIGDALQAVLDRGDFIVPLPDEAPGTVPARGAPEPIETDPAIVAALVAQNEASVAAMKREIATKSGPGLLDFIREDLLELKRLLFAPRSHQATMAGMEATWWLNDHLQAWLGEKNAADTLAQSAPGNITSEMGLALLDVADAIRPHREVVAFLERVQDDGCLDELPALPGGADVRDAIAAWLDRYGMRCPGEIDITRPRWSERPRALLPLLLGNVRHFAPGEARRRFDAGLEEASRKERELLHRLRALPDGAQKAAEVKAMIDRLRTFIGYREYPKYGMIRRYGVYKAALMAEAGRLVQAGVIPEIEDIFYLTFQELHDATRTRQVDPALVSGRKAAFLSHHALTPPRVLTSEGEAVTGRYRRDDFPAGALVGLAVSAGTIEGRARVILDMAKADLAPGDILVTPFTDPSWTPLFVAIAGLVTEVGGLMTHGAVIAREYGLPAVVGVEHATRRIRDGQRIRVHGTEGYVEILE
ncbi:MAG TPA: rifamycin-inactivating phosphotransferase [Gemmatimonadaceae bacterium]